MAWQLVESKDNSKNNKKCDINHDHTHQMR